MKRLQAHGWPGNIRELRNTVERAMLLSDSDELQSDDFTGSHAREDRESHEKLFAQTKYLEDLLDLLGREHFP